MTLTKEEQGILAIVQLNKLEKRQEIDRKWRFGRLEVQFHWQSSSSMWGRFGGGWQWALGFQAAGRTVILNLLICRICIILNTRTEVL